MMGARKHTQHFYCIKTHDTQPYVPYTGSLKNTILMNKPKCIRCNMRSTCRWSCVLQFTRRRAVCCGLHRPMSQVIPCLGLKFYFITMISTTKMIKNNSIPRRGPLISNPYLLQGECNYLGFIYKGFAHVIAEHHKSAHHNNTNFSLYTENQ